MAFIVPSAGFDTGKPILGALTGLTEGLAQGIKARRQQDLAQQSLQLQQQEQALRERAYAHGLQNEADIKAWAQKYGEFKAWDLAGAGAAPGQGPTSPGYQIPPESGIGPPMAVPQSAPQRGPMDQNAWIQKIQDLASTLPPDPKLREAFLASVEQDKQKQAIQSHKDRILSQYNDAILKGHFNTVGPDGTTNDATTVAAQGILQQVQSADPENPQEAAAILDHAEASLGQLGTEAAQHDFQMTMQRHTLESLDQQIQARKANNPPGNPIPDVSQAQAIRDLYAHGKMTDDELVKAWPDAINGTLALKNELAQHKMTAESYRLENERLKTELLEAGRNARAAAAIASRENVAGAHDVTAKDIADMRARGLLNREDQRTSRVNQELNAVVSGRALQAAMLDKDWGKADTDEKKAVIVDRYNKLQQRSNGGLVLPGAVNGATAPAAQDSAASILGDFTSGRADKPTAIKRAQALGYKSFDELQAAAGKK